MLIHLCASFNHMKLKCRTCPFFYLTAKPTSGYPRTPIRVRSSTINSDLGPLFIYASIGIPWGIGADREVVFVRRPPP